MNVTAQLTVVHTVLMLHGRRGDDAHKVFRLYDRIFHSFDRENVGVIDARELVSGLAALCRADATAKVTGKITPDSYSVQLWSCCVGC